jgi:hypothetical protein
LRPTGLQCVGVRAASGLPEYVVCVVDRVTSQFDLRLTSRNAAMAYVGERLYFVFRISSILMFGGEARITPITLCVAVCGLHCLPTLELWDHRSADRSILERICLLCVCVVLFRRGLATSRSPSRGPTRYLSTGFINQENNEPWVALACSWVGR